MQIVRLRMNYHYRIIILYRELIRQSVWAQRDRASFTLAYKEHEAIEPLSLERPWTCDGAPISLCRAAANWIAMQGSDRWRSPRTEVPSISCTVLIEIWTWPFPPYSGSLIARRPMPVGHLPKDSHPEVRRDTKPKVFQTFTFRFRFSISRLEPVTTQRGSWIRRAKRFTVQPVKPDFGAPKITRCLRMTPKSAQESGCGFASIRLAGLVRWTPWQAKD